MLQEIALKMQEFRELQSQSDFVWAQNTYLCKLHFIKQPNEGVKSRHTYRSHIWSCAACLHGWSILTGGGSRMNCKLQKHVFE